MTGARRGTGGTRNGIAVGWALLTGYIGAIAWITWPLAARFGTHVPAPYAIFDILHSVWVFGWEAHTLTTAPSTIADANIYHPTPLALYGPTAFGALCLYGPVFLATRSALVAMNATFLLGASLSAWGAHLVIARWTRSHLAGAVAGVALLTSTQLWWPRLAGSPHRA